MKLNFIEKASKNKKDAKMVVPFLLTESEANQIKGGGVVITCDKVTYTACALNMTCAVVGIRPTPTN